MVHPRVCGEQLRTKFRPLPSSGSSPRVRGTVPSQDSVPPRPRFIPACAGNRFLGTVSNFFHSVHPRVCGEQALTGSSGCASDGSSPRVRGTVSYRIRAVGRKRFIPACAGNRFFPLYLVPAAPVHPRVCGEQIEHIACCLLTAGSSPRVRGTGKRHIVMITVFRFIPACAGNRQDPAAINLPDTVHPRVCGEQAIVQQHPEYVLGSSPRVRGTVNCGTGRA